MASQSSASAHVLWRLEIFIITIIFVTFVVAYAPTEEVPEGQKAKCYMAVLDSTVASLPAREYVFVLTDAQDKEER